jgi:hypothetical protein
MSTCLFSLAAKAPQTLQVLLMMSHERILDQVAQDRTCIRSHIVRRLAHLIGIVSGPNLLS